MVGGIAAGAETRSVTGARRTDLSLYPTRKPSEKKTPQTATPAKKTRIRCRVERPLASRGESVFINITTLGAEEKLNSRFLRDRGHTPPGPPRLVKAPDARHPPPSKGERAGNTVLTSPGERTTPRSSYFASLPEAGLAELFPIKALNNSTGIGNTIVVFFSVPISAKVWR